MSQIVPKKRLTKKLRKQTIIDGLKNGDTIQTIADNCGVSEKTIDRDLSTWKDNGGFDKWLLTEFMRLHTEELRKEDGGQAYRVIADLLKKRLKEQQEISMTGDTFRVEIIDNQNSTVQTSPETT